jgi:vacuolar protein sorting-associated protein 45
MKRFIEIYPEFSRLAGNVSKHVTLSSELDLTIKERLLLNVSEIEQELACTENRSDQFRQVMEVIRDPRYQNIDKLKLATLFTLRYEVDDRVNQLKTALLEVGVRREQVDLISAMVEYAGVSVRSNDLFGNKNLLSRAKSSFKTVMKNVPNVYTQHQPYLSETLDALLKAKLKEADFPATTSFNPRERQQTVIVFIIGGVTYEEAKEVGLINRKLQDAKVFLGGSFIHNAASFLAEVAQLLYERAGL